MLEIKKNMDTKQLELFLTENDEIDVKKEEGQEKKEQVIMDKEFITESGKILLKD